MTGPRNAARTGLASRDGGPRCYSADGSAPRRWTLRAWSVRNAGLLERFYDVFSRALVALDRAFRFAGYERLEKPVAFLERQVKGALFDCRMCGQCILSATGMSCPMTCPKQLRNGPCGGVRANGNCEVIPDMPCVWAKAWQGSREMESGNAILESQPPVDHALRGRSSWLAVARAGNSSSDGGAS